MLSGGFRVIVASTNPVKIQAALDGFRRMLPDRAVRADGIAVPSAVSHQPRTDQETLRGAEERAARAMESTPDADMWVGIEGGVAEMGFGMAAFAWVVVQSRRQTGRARTGTFMLPEAVARLVRAGVELGDADDRVFGSMDSKRNMGAVGLLTGGVIDRQALYAHAVALALIPFRGVGTESAEA